MKHIALKHFFLLEKVKQKEVELIKVNTEDNMADIFTKAMDGQKFQRLRDLLGMSESGQQTD